MDGNTTGTWNTAIGFRSLTTNTTGYQNTATGDNSLRYNLSGSYNSASGFSSLTSNTTGMRNAGFGNNVLFSNTSGSYNTALGNQALFYNETGSNNVAIGHRAGYNETRSNMLYISNSATQNLIFGHFDTGDIQLGKISSGLVTTNNDAYIKGNLYVSGNIIMSAPESTGTQPQNTNLNLNVTNTSGPAFASGKLVAYASEITPTSSEDSSSESSAMISTEEVRQMRTSVGQHAAMLANNTSTLSKHKQQMTSMQNTFDRYQQETNQQMYNMKAEYSSGIASAIAISQINTSADGFSFGVGYGSFKGERETAMGVGYGITLSSGSRLQFNAGKNGDATGAGATISF